MLTGELPPRGRGVLEPPSRKVLIDVRLDEVVLRALERQPARRYQQVSEVRTHVETIVADEALNAQAASAEQQAHEPARPKAITKIGSDFQTSRRHVRWRKRIPLVGVRDGKHVICWPGVAVFSVLAALAVAAGAMLFDLLLYRFTGVSLIGWRLFILAVLGATIVISCAIVRALRLPIGMLTSVGNSPPREAGRNGGRWIAAIVILVVIGLVVWRPWLHANGAPAPSVSVPPANPQMARIWNAITLYGVMPDGGDDIFDAQGKPIGEAYDAWQDSYWGPDTMSRTLIFNVPKDVDLQWAIFPKVQVSQGGQFLGGGATGWTDDFLGKPRRILRLSFARTYHESGWLRSRQEPVNRIDVTLKYFPPGRGKAAVTFLPPFKVDQTVKCQDGVNATLMPKGYSWMGGRAMEFHLKATKVPGPEGIFQDVFAYDHQGKRYRLQPGGGSGRGSGRFQSADKDYTLGGIGLKEIAAITIGEVPQQKTFRNILVRYPGRPIRDYPPYLDKMAAALGLTGTPGKELSQYQFKNVAEVMKVIDIVRGRHVGLAWNTLRLAKIKSFSEADREKIRRAAKAWMDSGSVMGIELGLKGGWPEFVEPAMAYLQRGGRDGSEVAYHLQNFPELTPQQLAEIAALLQRQDAWPALRSLMQCLRHNVRKPGGQEAVLSLARSDKIWLWWPAMSILTAGPDGLKLVQLTPDLQVKRLAQTDPDLGLDAAMAARARALLAGAMTAKAAAMSISTISEVITRANRNLPREQFQSALLDLLRDMVAHWGEYPSQGYRWWPVDRALRYLNKLNGTNFGGVGADVNVETSDYGKVDWPAAAKKALKHFGRAPATAPATASAEAPAPPAGPPPVPSEKKPLPTFTVYDALGQPIPDAAVDFWPVPFSRGAQLYPRPVPGATTIHLQTDANGHFAIDLPIRVAGKSYLSFDGRVSQPQYGIAPVTFSGAVPRIVGTSLVRKGTERYERALKGLVVDDANEPVAGARVECHSAWMGKARVPGSAAVLTDSAGRFVLDYQRDNNRQQLLPAGSTYQVIVRAPAGIDLFPTVAKGQTPMKVVMRRPTLRARRLRFEVGKDQYVQGNERCSLRLVWVSPGKHESFILEPRYVFDQPVRLLPGQIRAQYTDGHDRYFDYLPVDVNDASPDVLTFRRPPPVTYHGRVVDGVTAKPVAGAIVFTHSGIRGDSNLAMLFERDWKNLDAMPAHPSPADPGVKSLNKHYVTEAVVRTDANGDYEITRGPEQNVHGLIVFAKDSLPVSVRLPEAAGDADQPAPVPTTQLFPAAYVKAWPQLPVGANDCVYLRWTYPSKGQPKWLDRLLKACPMANDPGGTRLSGPVRAFVPAGVKLKLRFASFYGAPKVVDPYDKVLDIAPGQTVDIGVVKFESTRRRAPSRDVILEPMPISGI